MHLKSVFAAVVALSAVGSASAVNYNFTMPLAPAAPFTAFGQIPLTGMSFTDFWTFTAPAGAVQASSSVISVDLFPFFNIDSMQVSLFNGANGSGSLVATGGIAEASELQNIAITAGNIYSFRVTGLVVGAPAGYYSFATVAAPIPEPQTYMMMIAGIGALGFLAMRRRRG